MQLPQTHSADAGAIGVANPICDLVLDKVENAGFAISGPQPPPVKAGIALRRLFWRHKEYRPAAPALNGWAGGGGGGGGVVVSVHLEALRAPLGANIVVVTLILRHGRWIFLNNLGKIPE